MSETTELVKLGLELLPEVILWAQEEGRRSGKSTLQVLIDNQSGYARNAAELEASKKVIEAMIEAHKRGQVA